MVDEQYDYDVALSFAGEDRETVNVEGVVLEMPRRLQDQAHAIDKANNEIYIYATTLK